MSIDEVFDVLLLGDEASITHLAGSGVHYRYSPNTGGFRVRRGGEIVSAHKVFDVPACVAIFGDQHTF